MSIQQRKLACDSCRKSKVRCDGKEGEKTCSRCLKKDSECTWNTPRCKRGRKTIPPKMSGDYEMGLFCLTPKNLIQLSENPRGSISKDDEEFWSQSGMGVLVPSGLSSSSSPPSSASATRPRHTHFISKRAPPAREGASTSLGSLPSHNSAPGNLPAVPSSPFPSPSPAPSPYPYPQTPSGLAPSKSVPTPIAPFPSLSASASTSTSHSHSNSPSPLTFFPQIDTFPVVRSTWPPVDYDISYTAPQRPPLAPSRKVKSDQEIPPLHHEDVRKRCSIGALVNEEDQPIPNKDPCWDLDMADS